MPGPSALPYPCFPPERHAAPWSASGGPVSPLDRVLGELLVRAGEAATRRFGAPTVTRKEDGTPVTDADTAAEALLVEGLRAAFPGDAVTAEEGGGHEGGRRLWVVDPLDGTAAFSEGLAHWGPVVAAIEGGEVVAGALYLPRLREYYFVERGGPAYRNGAPLPPLSQDGARRPGSLSVLYVPSRMHAGATLDWPGKARCLGSVAAHLALVAAGSGAGALIPPGWRPWDTAAGLALIEAVGGRALTADGQPLHLLDHAGQAFVVGDAGAVAWLSQPGRVIPRPHRAPLQRP